MTATDFSLAEITLSRQEIFLIAVLLVLIFAIGQYTIHMLRQRQKVMIAIFIFAMTIAASYAFKYYRSIHAPEIIAEQITYAGKKAGSSIIETNKEINSGMFHFARGYSSKNYEEIDELPNKQGI